MADKETSEAVDITNAWAATQDQKGKAKKLRLFAGLSWLVAIGTEIVGLLVVIAIFAIAGSLMWKRANKHDPASREDKVRFFVQNQLGAIITLIAFLPLLAMVFLDKDMDPKTKKVAGGKSRWRNWRGSALYGAIYTGYECLCRSD